MNKQFDTNILYDRYRVQIKFRSWLCGGMPRNKDLIRTWVEAQTEHADEETNKQVAELEETVNEVSEKCWNGFPEGDEGLFIWTRQVKALFRECSTVLGMTREKRGSKQIIQHAFEVKGTHGLDLQRIYLGKKAPDGTEEKAIHVMTAQGPRSALRRTDYVEGVELTFEVWVLGTSAQESRHIGEKDIVRLLTLAQENGLGACRSQGHGKFDVVEFEKIADAPIKSEVKKEFEPKGKKKENAKTLTA